ncbi:MAG: DNA-directed DNA polymerase II small subunit, partial [Candidatus Altarchaeaceae archaeon]
SEEYLTEEKYMKELLEEKLAEEIKIFRENIKPNFKIFEYFPKSEGTVNDFVNYFNSRYEKLSKIIKQRVDYKDVEEIKSIKENTNTKIIGMIREKRTTKENVTILTVEDKTGVVDVYINETLEYGDKKEHLETLKILPRLVPDEVIGIKGRVGKNKKITATEIVEPDIPNLNGANRNRANNDIYVAFLSDLHIGSYLFMEKEFKNFIDWVNLKGNRKEIAENLKYILIAGDIVDGVGVYPEQKDELSIPDIYKQYKFTARLLKEIPEEIEIFMIVGNHDAVPLAEPQLPVSKEFAEDLYKMKNVHILPNPSLIIIENVKILMYHGASMDKLISAIPGLSYSAPEKAMEELLKKRHLNPIYKDIYPTEKDYLVIEEIPDIIHCGHLHTNGYGIYKGVYLINSGTFQRRSKYQEQLGHFPTPGKVPIMNLKNFSRIELNFNIQP